MSANRSNIAWHLENQMLGENQRAIGMVYEKQVELTSAEILALYTTPKELVEAPGAGKVLEFLSAVLFLDYGTATYATRGDLTINLHTTGTALSDTVAAADFVQQTADAYRVMQALSADVALKANEALELRCATGNPDTGDSTIKVLIRYCIHDFSGNNPRHD